MARGAEIAGFTLLAASLHVLAFAGPLPALFATDPAAEAQTAQPALSAAPAQLAALAERWETPPEAQADTPPDPPAPEVEELPVAADPATDRAPEADPPARPDAVFADTRPGDIPAVTAPAPRAVPVPVAPQAPTAPDLPVDRPVAAANLPPQTAGPQSAPRRPDTGAGAVSRPVIDTTPAPVYDSAAPEVSERPRARPAAKPEPAVATARAKPAVTPRPEAKTTRATPAKPAPRSSAQQTRPAAPAQAPQKARKAAPKGPSPDAMQKWQARIAASIRAQQRFPAGVRKGGTVQLALRVSASGRLTGVSLRRSSGVAALDRAALRAARSARLPRAPKGAANKSHAFKIRLHFKR